MPLSGMTRIDLISSDKKMSSAVIKASTGLLGGILGLACSNVNASITLYDNATTGSGTKLFEIVVPGTDKYGGYPFGENMVRFNTGCYLSLSGTGAAAIVYYK